MSKTNQGKKLSLGQFLIGLVLVIIIVGWTIPTLGIFVTSFRDSRDIYGSGWWTVLPHKDLVKSDEFELPSDTNPNIPVTIEGVTATFEEWRQGQTLEDGRTLRWYGNKRSRKIEVFQEKWIGFGANLTLQNYRDVLSGREVSYQDAQGNTISRQGNNFSDAVLNSLAVSIPATVIPILIAAFAAYAFAWMEFPGRRPLFIMVVALLVVPLQIALIPILRDYTRWGLNGTFVGMWLAHTGFGLPLAIYLLYNYISTLPRDIFESAYLDGATPFTTFVRLVLPLSIPALASFAIFQFLWVWNDYLVALVFLGDKNRVVTSALAAMIGEKGQDWHLLTSGAFLSMILPLAVFFGLQKFFIRGLMAGSVKG
ncbi:MAG: carbohydrate ABC transporter permease [Spirochaetes bacterium]|nr:MAG: carbohydrate ABC transporter permease [Spirochaetota bacterium]RKX77945.1 MAG: carbohydrate ABC transporter permease [Spirochaetota bacterium]RKX86012.1 MAG: carbohydrate ABC transporter permease [Spirochaetota bacterium]RKX96928.1 MAG: carbohydrate ABC transporter permease [Spirochaetota bacterium]